MLGHSGVWILPMIAYSRNRMVMQRLFSTFADGWPGVGLLLLRFLVGISLVSSGIYQVWQGSIPILIALQVIGVGAGIVLILGFFTPVAGTLAAVAKVSIAIAEFSSHIGEPSIAMTQAALAAALAMIGPGAWSIDARRFGRKRIISDGR